MNRHLYTPHWMASRGPVQLGLFDRPRELTEFDLNARINFRFNCHYEDTWTQGLTVYEKFVKAIRFSYCKGFMEQFIYSPFLKTSLKIQDQKYEKIRQAKKGQSN